MKKDGFSLVELSIVLVILGLLTGGILAGQSLIRAAELRSVTTESQQMVAALHTFRDKYMGLPGDLANGTAFWGKNATYCNGDSGVANASTGTCNGNGSGIWDTAGAANSTDERFQAIRQLALAGLVSGSYTGISGSGGVSHCIPGTNCPQAKIGNGAWGAAYATFADADVFSYAVDYGNYLFIGAPIANSGPFNPLLKPEEAWNLDSKMDDGRPATGRVIARYWNNQCAAPDSGATANTNLNASYRLSDSTLRCALYFTKN